MEFMSAQQAADQWGISKRRVLTLCASQRIADAVRIGNIWVIPINAQKPDDARIKDSIIKSRCYNPIREARRELRTISSIAFREAHVFGISILDVKKSIMALLSSELIEHILNMPSKNISERVHDMFGINTFIPDNISENIRKLFRKFLHNHPFCYDDALSWIYQFINKLCKDTGLETTQFFTEKYMITTLVDLCHIENSIGKILDPACGGGNFLLYALDYLCDNSRIPKETNLAVYVKAQLDRLYGYELDPTLALIASINLRVKALSIIQESGYLITEDDIISYIPNIYCSVESNIEGALDIDSNTHLVRKLGTERIDYLTTILRGASFIFTNPPFQTVKGMDKKQKNFLKDKFPNAKCDMCNAFIELVLSALKYGGICGIVTQNSWMYLDSFSKLRESLLERYSMSSIIELGSNAFYDLSGEKANVVLFIAQNAPPTPETSIETYSLKHLTQVAAESILSSNNGIEAYKASINQLGILVQPGYRFGTLSTNRTQLLQKSCPTYGEYATPMQGTSTGDSKSLVGYFWDHIGDSNWRPVSKGGGYSRWLGQNSYSVKWGENGEYIKETQGSAIRNAKHFSETQLVFSDTGTAGLNVRLLREGQIFIASGPGIRVIQGDYLSHIAFLNSRIASYFIRLFSPKLTIAAGYIAKIPTLEELLTSKILSELARTCIEHKANRLSSRPIYLEYKPIIDPIELSTLSKQAQLWFLMDIEDEWQQLQAEHKTDKHILDAFGFSSVDRENLCTQVGPHALDIEGNNMISVDELDKAICDLISVNCLLNKTRAIKNHLGCDGIIEYIAHVNYISPKRLKQTIVENVEGFTRTLAKYRDAYIHNIVLAAIGYSTKSLPQEKTDKGLLENVLQMFPNLGSEIDTIDEWITKKLTEFHNAAFLGAPLIYYSKESSEIKRIGR